MSTGFLSLFAEDRRDFDKLEVREETFVLCPPAPIPTAEIAAAGFYYTGENDIIKCCQCAMTLQIKDAEMLSSLHRPCAPVPAVPVEPVSEADLVELVSEGPNVSLPPPTARPKVAGASSRLAELKEENKRLRLTWKCKKCGQPIEMLFLPCRHLVACNECGAKMDQCIACDKKILGTVQTYVV